MSIFTDMNTKLATVPTLMGVTWQRRNRTSARDAATAAFDAWADIDVLPLEYRTDEDAITNGAETAQSVMIRVASTAGISIGSQVKDTAANIWHVAELVSSGIGTERYLCERKARSQFGDLREGGF